MSEKKELIEAKLDGLYDSNNILVDALVRLQTSLNDYAAIEYHDFYPDGQGREKVAFAKNTLEVLSDLFRKEFDRKIKEVKLNLESGAKIDSGWANIQSQTDMGLEIESMDNKTQEIRYTVPDWARVTFIYNFDGTFQGYELDRAE